ncbi:MAG: GH3 auxin-responsive promoter family protein, partial [Verrucomicrobia bacterium]|nr:GH3 auxin-responsive promoter family protein [Verrucomicrobiota bacterium]
LRHVADLESFRYITLLCLLRQPGLRLISVWHPSFLTLLLDALPAAWPTLLDDLRGGTCRGAGPLPASVRAALNLRPAPARAAQLAGVGPLHPTAIWSELRLVSCWGDAHAAGALAALRARLPGVLLQAKGLLATEAFVTVPFAGAHPLALCSHFFEFIDENAGIRQAHELVRGQTYEVVVTTGGGLWRYRLGDRVEVAGFVARTPSLRFLGRAGHGSDLCGEKLAEEFVAHVLAAVVASHALAPKFALLAPSPEATPPCYTLFIEAPAVPVGLARQLDSALRTNPHYALCRDLGQLGALRVATVAARGYERFFAAELARGARLGEIKPVALSRRTDWARHLTASFP